MFKSARKVVLLALLSLTLSQISVLAIQQPPLDYAFTITTVNEDIIPPIPLSGYNQTLGFAVNSTLTGPLLNATLITLSFTEQKYGPTTNNNVSYSTSQANAIYQTDDGLAFSLQQNWVTSSKADVATLELNIGGDYAYLAQYKLVCYIPITSGSRSTSNATDSTSKSPSMTSTGSLPLPSNVKVGPAARGQADCFVVGGL